MSASAMSFVLAVYRLNTRLLLNCLSDMTPEHATARASANTNHALFLALHLLDTRFFLTRALGLSEMHPFEQLLANARTIDDIAVLPDLQAVVSSWSQLAPILEARLAALGAEELDAKPSSAFPVDDD